MNPERSIPILSRDSRTSRRPWFSDKPTFREICPRVRGLPAWARVRRPTTPRSTGGSSGAEVSRAGGSLPSARRLCTVRLARRFCRTSAPVARPGGACTTASPFEARHRAMGDALATAQCLIRLLDDAGTRGLDTWTDLERLLRARTGGCASLPAVGAPAGRPVGAGRVSAPAPLHQQRRHRSNGTSTPSRPAAPALDGGAMFGVVPKTLWVRRTPADDRNRIPSACDAC